MFLFLLSFRSPFLISNSSLSARHISRIFDRCQHLSLIESCCMERLLPSFIPHLPKTKTHKQQKTKNKTKQKQTKNKQCSLSRPFLGLQTRSLSWIAVQDQRPFTNQKRSKQLKTVAQSCQLGYKVSHNVALSFPLAAQPSLPPTQTHTYTHTLIPFLFRSGQ